ncbi:HlyD family secretion protein [Aquimarina agarilytica]|uniref:HlyD family secretion protein n=1 Tax=Aquimarina agarilytica TaxID=1087449 RepID=UPI0002887353|nr:HlyD family efflux transporter periplasmic adaptor subunit [Aquimarina agarilytica]
MEHKLQHIELRSEEVQELLTKVPHWMIRWGSVLFFILIVLLLLISYLVKYPDSIPCQAVVTSELPPEKIYAQKTGKIAKILTPNNSLVNENTPIAILQNTANYKDVFLLKSIVDTLKVNNKTFDFPFDELPVLYLGEINTAFILFENSYSEYVLNKNLNPFDNEKRAHQISMIELKKRLYTTINQKEIQKQELELQQKDLSRQEQLFSKGVISSQAYENRKLSLLQAEREYNSIALTISQLNEQISQANKNNRGTTVNSTREEVRLFKNVIQSYNQLKTALQQWEINYVLKASTTGTLSFLNHWSINQSVTKGDFMFTVIPEKNKDYVVKLKAPLVNSGKIKKGQRVNINLDTYPEQEFGMLIGEIKRISLVPDANGQYIIDALLPNKLVTSYNKSLDFKQEMSGSAQIITEDLRLIERFFYQLRKAFDRS